MGTHQIVVDLSGVCERLLDGLFGNFVEDHPFDRYFGLQHFVEMPADALAFPVFVRGQNQLVRVFERGAQFGDDLFLGGRDDVERIEILLHIHSQSCPRLFFYFGRNLTGRGRQVADMAHTGFDHIAFGQEVADGFRFGGRFDND